MEYLAFNKDNEKVNSFNTTDKYQLMELLMEHNSKVFQKGKDLGSKMITKIVDVTGKVVLRKN